MVSGTISLALPAFFSTFIHITCALSVVREYLALARGQAGFLRSFPCSAVLGYLAYPVYSIFAYRTFTFFGRHFHTVLLIKQLCIKASSPYPAAAKTRNLLVKTDTAYRVTKI